MSNVLRFEDRTGTALTADLSGPNVTLATSSVTPPEIYVCIPHGSVSLGIDKVKRLRDGLNQFIADVEGLPDQGRVHTGMEWDALRSLLRIYVPSTLIDPVVDRIKEIFDL